MAPLKIYFIIFKFLLGRQLCRKKDRERDKSYPLAHSPNGHEGRDCGDMNPGERELGYEGGVRETEQHRMATLSRSATANRASLHCTAWRLFFLQCHVHIHNIICRSCKIINLRVNLLQICQFLHSTYSCFSRPRINDLQNFYSPKARCFSVIGRHQGALPKQGEHCDHEKE